MTYIDLFTEPVYRTYRAAECSWSGFYMKLVHAFRYFLPLFIVFMTDGVWKKTNHFREVPDISFTGDFIVYAYGHDRSIISTSFGVLNSAASSDQLSTSQIRHHFSKLADEDETQAPRQNLELEVQMSTQNLSIDTLMYAFLFRIRLHTHSDVDTQLFLTETLRIAKPISRIQTIARLSIDQSDPFQPRNLNFRMIDRRRQDVEHFQIQSILRRQSEAPFALSLQRKSTLFLSALSPPPTLSLQLSLAIPEMDFSYRTGPWELLKWFFVQYIVVFLAVDYVFCSLTSYLFRNRVFWVTDVIRSR